MAEAPLAEAASNAYHKRPRGADLLALIAALVAVGSVGAYQIATEVVVPIIVPPVDHLETCGDAIASVQFDYAGGATGYLTVGFPPYQWCEAIGITPGTSLTAILLLHNLDTNNTHRIDGITLSWPFPLSGVSPAVPVTIQPGGYLTLGITFEAPYSNNGQAWPSATVSSG